MKLLYKIGASLLALAGILTLCLLPLVSLHAAVPVLSYDLNVAPNLKQLLSGNLMETQNEQVNKILSDAKFSTVWENLGELRPAIIICAVSLCLAVLLMAALILLPFFTKKKTVTAALSGGGLLCALSASISFGFFASPIKDGSFDVLSLLGDGAQALSTVVNTISKFTGNLYQVSVLKPGIAITLFTVLFILILFWSVLFYVLEIMLDGGRQPKKQKQLTPAQRAAKKAKQDKKHK